MHVIDLYAHYNFVLLQIKGTEVAEGITRERIWEDVRA